MRYAERGDLFDFIDQNGSIDEIQCVKWTKQIASAIQYLHILDYAHRDLKCENILITNDMNLKLSDFGFVRLFSAKDAASETYCGSIVYSPPEVINRRPYNPKAADMWSFGVIIYMMLNGEHPFSTSDISLLHEEQVNRDWKIVTKIYFKLSENAVETFRMLLEPVPSKRWKIEEFIECNWMKSFPNETKFTKAEIEALDRAKYGKSKCEDQQKKSASVVIESDTAENLLFTSNQ